MNIPPSPLILTFLLGCWLSVGGVTFAQSNVTDTANVDPGASLAPSSTTSSSSDAKQATLSTEALKEFTEQPEAIKQLITQGLALTRASLSYKYGSADPKNGGMDCSGTIYFLLSQAGLKEVPRDSSELYKWVWQQSHFESVESPNASTFELDRLKPGDLLFWSGTYQIDRDPPITHVMLYLGTMTTTGQRVMLGASEGRTFAGKSRYGVSVFDFKMPGKKALTGSSQESGSGPRFIGYGAIPGLK